METSSPAVVSGETAPSRPIRIYIVDDQTLFRQTLSLVVAQQPGLVVIGEASNGEEAIRRALIDRPDLILMDVGLPKVDGLEATRRIKAEAPSVRVIAITAYPSFDMLRRAMAAGVDSFVLKDAKVDELSATIRLTIAGRRVFNGGLLERFLDSVRQPSEPHNLTARELEVLQSLAAGHSNAIIASRLRVREKTVRNHISNIYAKLGVSGRTQAVLYALRTGIVADAGIPLPGGNQQPK
jgi:DNA-binding NarL/FixJ family response regulator